MSVAEPAVSGLETAAAERLYERNSSRVYAYCLQMLRSREDAEDASQTTFMQAFRALQRGVVPVFETAWLLTIARNVCLARHRAGRRRRAVELARDPHDLQELAAGREQDGSLAGLQEALARLPEMQRRAFLLREWQERSYAEIAAELDVTVPAVEALLFRARRSLARDLGDGGRRRLALDLTSLVATVKAAFGGGAAVKVAVGAAVVVGAGAAAGGVAQKVDSRAPVQTRVPAVVERTSPVSPSGRMNGAMKASAPAATTSVAGQSGRVRPEHDPVSERPVSPTTPSAPEIPSEPSVPTAPPVPSAPEVPPGSEAGAAEPSVPAPPAVPEAPAIPPPPAIPAAPAVPPPPAEVPKAPSDVLPVAPPPIPEAPELPDAPSVPGLPLGP